MFPDGNSDSDIQRHRWMLIMTLVLWHLTFSCWQWPSCDSSHQHSDIYCWSSSHDRNPALINYPNKRMHKYKRYRNHSEWEMLHDAWAAAVARIPAHPRMPLLSSQNRWVEDTQEGEWIKKRFVCWCKLLCVPVEQVCSLSRSLKLKELTGCAWVGGLAQKCWCCNGLTAA